MLAAVAHIPVALLESYGDLRHDRLERAALGDDGELPLAHRVEMLGGNAQRNACHRRNQRQRLRRGAADDLDLDAPIEARIHGDPSIGMRLPLLPRAKVLCEQRPACREDQRQHK